MPQNAKLCWKTKASLAATLAGRAAAALWQDYAIVGVASFREDAGSDTGLPYAKEWGWQPGWVVVGRAAALLWPLVMVAWALCGSLLAALGRRGSPSSVIHLTYLRAGKRYTIVGRPRQVAAAFVAVRAPAPAQAAGRKRFAVLTALLSGADGRSIDVTRLVEAYLGPSHDSHGVPALAGQVIPGMPQAGTLAVLGARGGELQNYVYAGDSVFFLP